MMHAKEREVVILNPYITLTEEDTHQIRIISQQKLDNYFAKIKTVLHT